MSATDTTMVNPEKPTKEEKRKEARSWRISRWLFTILFSVIQGGVLWLVWTYWNLGSFLWPTLPDRFANMAFLDLWGLAFCARVVFSFPLLMQVRRPKATRGEAAALLEAIDLSSGVGRIGEHGWPEIRAWEKRRRAFLDATDERYLDIEHVRRDRDAALAHAAELRRRLEEVTDAALAFEPSKN